MNYSNSQGNLIRFLKTIDIYGKPVGLYYKKKRSYQTTLGGVCTVITILGIVQFMATGLSEILQRQFEIINKTNALNQMFSSNPYHVSYRDFDVMLQMYYDFERNPDVKLRPQRYYNIVVQHYSGREDDFGNQNEQYTPIATIPCTEHFAEDSDKQKPEIKQKYQNATCLDTKEYTFEGNLDSKVFQMYMISLRACNERDLATKGFINETCASPEEISDFFSNSFLMFIYVQGIFDEQEFGDEFVYKTTKSVYRNFDMNKSFVESIFVNKKEVLLKDSWVSDSLDNQNQTFYDVSLGDTTTGSIIPFLYDPIYIRIVQSGEEFTIVRRRSNIIDLMSEAGGFFKIIQLGIALLISQYVEALYLDSIMGNLFKAQRNLMKSHQIIKGTRPVSFSGEEEHLHSRLMNSMLNRLPLELRLLQTKYQKCLRPCKKFRIPKEQIDFNNDCIEKIYKEFSVNNVIKRIRQSRILTQLSLNKHQRKFLPYLAQNLVHIQKSSASAKRKVFKQEIIFNSKEFKKYAIKKYRPIPIYERQLQLREKAKEVEDKNSEKNLSKSLHYLIRKRKENRINQQMLKFLVNCEESDYFEQLILIHNLIDSNSKDLKQFATKIDIFQQEEFQNEETVNCSPFSTDRSPRKKYEEVKIGTLRSARDRMSENSIVPFFNRQEQRKNTRRLRAISEDEEQESQASILKNTEMLLTKKEKQTLINQKSLKPRIRKNRYL